MDLNIKLLKSPDGENHLIIITGERIDAEGLKKIFRQVEDTTQFLLNCKVLVDLEDASLRIEHKRFMYWSMDSVVICGIVTLDLHWCLRQISTLFSSWLC